MTDGFTFAGLGSSTGSEQENKIINMKLELSKPTILIDIYKAKRNYVTKVTGLTEAYLKSQNNQLTAKELIQGFKKKKGCQGTLKQNDENADQLIIIFGGKHREELTDYLQQVLDLDDDQIKSKGV